MLKVLKVKMDIVKKGPLLTMLSVALTVSSEDAVANSHIGIKIADGSFFSILDEQNRGARKQLVLTTVTDNQDSVQIDLYRGEGAELRSAEYVGSLIIQSIVSAAAGEPEIQLVLGLDESGNLNATASDIGSGEYQSLSVSLESFDEEDTYSIPDFELDSEVELGDINTEVADFGDIDSGIDEDYPVDAYEAPAYDDEPLVVHETPIRSNPAPFVGFLVLSLAAVSILAYLIFELLRGPERPPLQAFSEASHMFGMVLSWFRNTIS